MYMCVVLFPHDKFLNGPNYSFHIYALHGRLHSPILMNHSRYLYFHLDRWYNYLYNARSTNKSNFCIQIYGRFVLPCPPVKWYIPNALHWSILWHLLNSNVNENGYIINCTLASCNIYIGFNMSRSYIDLACVCMIS